jgi:hypothetical protein
MDRPLVLTGDAEGSFNRFHSAMATLYPSLSVLPVQ